MSYHFPLESSLLTIDCSTDIELEEFHKVVAAQMNEFEDILCYCQSNMRSVNSFTVFDNGGMG